MRGSGLPTLLFANSIAPASRSPWMTSSTRPSSFACSELIGFPVVIMRTASAIEMTRGRRCVPPDPGRIPSFTSGSPSCARGAATR